MREKQSVKVIECTMLVLIVVFFLSIHISGANQDTPSTHTSSTSQSKQTPKITQVQSEPSTPSPSSFRPDMAFADAIDILRNSTKPPLNIAVLWKDLEENADVYRDTLIGIEGLSGVSLRMHLRLLLMGISAGSAVEVGYTVDDGVIIIATRESLPAKMSARVYDVTDLVAPPANYFFFPSPGIPFGVPMGGLGGLGLGGNYGMGYQGAGAGMYPGGYGNDLTGLIQNQYRTGGRMYGNYYGTKSTR